MTYTDLVPRVAVIDEDSVMLCQTNVTEALVICTRLAQEGIPFVLSAHARGASISVGQAYADMLELCRMPTRYPSRPLTDAEAQAVACAMYEGESPHRLQA